MKVGEIDVEALQNDRDQLLAEAVKRYDEAGKWHPDAKFEREHIYPEQDARFETDAWEEPIRDYLKTFNPPKVYIKDIFEGALHIELNSRDRAKTLRISAVLPRLGWVRLKKDSKGNIPWGPPPGDG